MSEAQKKHEEEMKERDEYGRFWVWDGYINENTKDQFLAAAE